MKGIIIKSLDIGIQRPILTGITLKEVSKVLLILDIPKVMYLGIPA
jgi:hypothetical protein